MLDKVSSISSRRFLGGYYHSHGDSRMPEFYAGAALVYGLPPLMFSIVCGQFSPLVWLLALYGVGLGLGWVLFEKFPYRVESCVPAGGRAPQKKEVLKLAA